jgi:hypothetical protein
MCDLVPSDFQGRLPSGHDLVGSTEYVSNSGHLADTGSVDNIGPAAVR